MTKKTITGKWIWKQKIESDSRMWVLVKSIMTNSIIICLLSNKEEIFICSSLENSGTHTHTHRQTTLCCNHIKSNVTSSYEWNGKRIYE